MGACDLLFRQLDTKIGEITLVSDTLSRSYASIQSGVDSIASVDLVDLAEDTLNLNTSLGSEVMNLTAAISDATGDTCGALDDCIDGIGMTLMSLANTNVPIFADISLPGGSLVGELSALANGIEGFASELVSFGLDSILGFADNYIGCIMVADPTSLDDLQTRIDSINGSLEGAGLALDGTLDTDVLWGGVDPNIKDSVTTVSDTISISKETITATAKSVLPVSNTKLPISFI
jgi:hypothetical protein